MMPAAGTELRWLDSYRQSHAALLAADPDFAEWLDSEYRPIAGAWLY